MAPDSSPALTLADVDLDDVVLARNDGHPESTWWFDPATGQCLYFGPEDDTDRPALRSGDGLRLIDHDPQPVTDGDEFLTMLAQDDGPTAAALHRVLHGRRGWRRFREAVVRSDAVDAWQQFAIDRERSRSVAWLVDAGLIGPE
jgi:hypothetical protein